MVQRLTADTEQRNNSQH